MKVSGTEMDFVKMWFDNQAPLAGVLKAVVGKIEPSSITTYDRGVQMTIPNPKANLCDSVLITISQARNLGLCKLFLSFCKTKTNFTSIGKVINLEGLFAKFDGQAEYSGFAYFTPGSFSLQNDLDLTNLDARTEQDTAFTFEIKGCKVLDYGAIKS